MWGPVEPRVETLDVAAVRPVPARRTLAGWRVWAVLALVAVAARVVTFGNPIVHTDEEFYLVFARAIVGGAVPYVDIWDRKPIGLFAIYLVPALFPLSVGVIVYQMMALAAVIATAAMIARLAQRVGWRRGALAAGALYILWLDLADGQGGQAPVFYNLLMVAAVVLVAVPPVPRRRGLAAMALVGVALQIKYSVVFEGVAIGLWLLWQDRGQRWPAILTYGAGLCAIALLPTLAALAGFWAIGAGPAFLYANFFSILARHPDPASEAFTNIETAAAILAPLLILAIASWREALAPRGATRRPAQMFVFAWLGASLLGFAVFGSWFNHYTLPVMVPAAVCAAGIFGSSRFGRWTTAAMLTAGLIAGQIVLHAERRARGTSAEFAGLVKAVGAGPGTLFAYSGSAMLYAATGRRPLSRYALPSHLHLARERGAIGVEQSSEIRRIFARGPDVVVTQTPVYEEEPALTALVYAELARRGYVLGARVPVGRRVLYNVYRRPTTPASRPPAR
jgi:hypothetical protein